MKTILVRNGRLIDPDTHFDGVADILLKEGRIARVAEHMKESADIEIDAAGMWVMPGLIDMHVHLRDPGFTWKEDVVTGSKAAARGGITTVIAMPNTKPVCDSPDRVDYVIHKAEHTAPVHVLQTGAVTAGQKGEMLSDIRGMVEHGIPAVSEDGKSVMNAELAREAMKICREENIPFLDHCEDRNLVQGGCVNEDAVSRKEGLRGITNSVEDVIIARDMILAHETGAHLHLCHCSTKGSYEMLKAAKEMGWDVSGEVCPHHFALTSSDRVPGDTNYKMNPPLRTEEDRKALCQGLAEGVFEVISTDHAPHTREEKAQSMEKAPFGISGLETSVSLTITYLVKPGILTPMQMAERMSGNPARILHLEGRGSLAEGREADLTIIDPEKVYTIDARDFESRGRNTPFDGCEVTGQVHTTICGGKIVYQKGRIYYD
ncbi:MAG: dihydroorotase family protein [Bilifractor sp.]